MSQTDAVLHARPLQAASTAQLPGVRPVSVALIFILSFIITVLPYLIFETAVPFGSDMQHPQMLLKLVTEGEPQLLYPDYLNRQYPDTYGYLTAVFAVLGDVEPLGTLAVITSLCMLMSLATVYFVARELYGDRAGVFALVAFGLLSLQPRQTYLDGTRIELVTGLVLAPLALLALHHTLDRLSWRWTAAAAVLYGALIRYHFLGTVQAALSSLFFVALFVLQGGRLNRGLLARLGVIVGGAALLSAPYSVYYAEIVGRILLGRLGLAPVAAEQEATFPAINAVTAVLDILGMLFVILGVMAVGSLAARRAFTTKGRTSDLMMLAWGMMLAIGTFTPALLVPERFLRNSAIPASVLIGALLAAVASRRLFSALVIPALLAIGMPGVFGSMVRLGYSTAYASSQDLPSLTALGNLARQLEGRATMADDSGVWAPYYVGPNARYVAGGPAGFLWFGEPLRSEMMELWEAHRAPCLDTSLATFEKYQVDLVYVGRRPTHWTLPGYTYNDGRAYLACRWYTIEYAERTDDGPIFIVARLQQPLQWPTWAPGGITPANARLLRPPAPVVGDPDEWAYRMWYVEVQRASADVLGLDPDDEDKILEPEPFRDLGHIWAEADSLRRAAQAGVRGDRRHPGFHFQLWLQLGQPADADAATVSYAQLVDKRISLPPEGSRTPAMQRWYMANRAKYNVVYYGVEDPEPIIHQTWAASHDDLLLYNEITAMWSAEAEGVRGSPDNPRAEYDAWLTTKLSAAMRQDR